MKRYWFTVSARNYDELENVKNFLRSEYRILWNVQMGYGCGPFSRVELDYYVMSHQKRTAIKRVLSKSYSKVKFISYPER